MYCWMHVARHATFSNVDMCLAPMNYNPTCGLLVCYLPFLRKHYFHTCRVPCPFASNCYPQAKSDLAHMG